MVLLYMTYTCHSYRCNSNMLLRSYNIF